jgi:peptidoglycan/xylan/chitin deacetylase (PgdA/CDA1 family)
MLDLWNANHPRNFWLCQPDFPDEVWFEAITHSLPHLEFQDTIPDTNSFLELTLGEGQFGPDRYRFGFSKQLYYILKPFLPRAFAYILRQVYSSAAMKSPRLDWPIEPRYAYFLWKVLHQALLIVGKTEIEFRFFWPGGKQFAFVLTHDVETAEGQKAIPVLADLEESLGFRSSFNFVPERYPLDFGLIHDLHQRGFEIGIHGLKHDGRLFETHSIFIERAKKINYYLHELKAVGLRTPLTHRNPEWLQALEMEYDLSFFDTDPYEPMPGGVMSIWPFYIGHFLELPYTLPQDSTLFNILGENSPRIWLKKIAFVQKNHGMALMLVHPDYSGEGPAYQYYVDFLKEISGGDEYWHALPREVASWWRTRSEPGNALHQPVLMAQATIMGDDINIEIRFNENPIQL